MTERKIKIYTTGYTGKDVADLKDLLDALDAVLFDIRFSPNSRMLKWTKNYLQVLLREKYQHVHSFGNRTFRENKVTIHNLELGLKILNMQNSNVILMCGCAELKKCHRFILTNELRHRDFEVREIEDWKITRTTLF